MLFDTARHYYPTKTIKEIIDVLASAKFSVLHWHLVDDESFPIQLDSLPELAQNGAFSADEVYTKEMVLDIVNYAKILGIRVIPEIDNPGHSRAIGHSPNYRDIIRCYDRTGPVEIPGAYDI